ncbi:MAG TPA: hypothetical protein DCQ31_08650, partial [Bacteroidales bacterium]|nr:hypothetical protein [Bacteroidales bacterium]
MTKKYKNKLKNPIPQVEMVKEPEKKSVSKINFLPYAILFILSLLLYGNTLKNDYVLDDVVVITQNEFTKKGFAGISEIFSYDTFTGYLGKQKKLVAGGRYRPLSVATFAVEYQFFGKMPWFSHVINLLLYAGIVLLLYKIFDNLFRQRFMATYKWYLSPAFFVALLYLFHPIHTEAVANIKGRDELMTFLGALIAMWYSIKYVETKNLLNLVYIFIAFFLGLLSKENTITFLAIIPLTLYFFTQSKLKQILIALAPALLASVVFLIIRQTIIGGFSDGTTDNLINNAFAEANTSQRYGTVFYTFLVYLK